jgi:hypothetical protein
MSSCFPSAVLARQIFRSHPPAMQIYTWSMVISNALSNGLNSFYFYADG